MTENEKKQASRILRIALRTKTEKVLRDWKVQLQQQFPAFEPSWSDLIAWGVERSPTLSRKQVQEIKVRLFDEVKELESLLSRVRIPRVDGDDKAVSDILSGISIRRKSSNVQATSV